MSVINIASSSAFYAALKTVKPGDTMAFAPGTYSGIIFNSQHFSKAITITSADPNHPAVFSGISVGFSSGITFKGVEFTTVGSKDPYYPFRVAYSDNITFTNDFFHGPIGSPNSQWMNGPYVSNSTNITFTHNQFEYLGAGMVVNNNDHVTISDNSFSYLNKGGIEMGGTSDVNILDNNFTDFFTNAGGHGDVIQVYTQGSTTSAHDIDISGNVYVRGDGMAAQGIFMQDTVNHRFDNVTIDNNVMLGGEWNGIYVWGATGNIQINNNTVGSWAGFDPVTQGTTGFGAWIRTGGDLSGAHITMLGNDSQAYLQGSWTVATPAGNTHLPYITDGGSGLLTAWAHANVGQEGLLSSPLLSLAHLSGVSSTTGILLG